MSAVDRAIAVAAGATVVVLAGVAGAISYSHMAELAPSTTTTTTTACRAVFAFEARRVATLLSNEGKRFIACQHLVDLLTIPRHPA